MERTAGLEPASLRWERRARPLPRPLVSAASALATGAQSRPPAHSPTAAGGRARVGSIRSARLAARSDYSLASDRASSGTGARSRTGQACFGGSPASEARRPMPDFHHVLTPCCSASTTNSGAGQPPIASHNAITCRAKRGPCPAPHVSTWAASCSAHHGRRRAGGSAISK